MNVSYPLARSARSYPTKEAIYDIRHDVRLTFAELDRRVSRLANALVGVGVGPGDRVAQLQRNSYAFVETMFATARIGVARVPVNPRLSADDVAYILADSSATVLICDPDFLDAAEQALRDVDSLTTVITHGHSAGPLLDYETLLADASDSRPGLPVDDASMARLNYTGGTTGRPKGVMTNHNQLMASALNILTDHVPMRADDTVLHTQPLSAGGGAYVIPAIARGARQVILPGFQADEVLATCKAEAVTFLKVVPTMYVRMLTGKEFESSLATVRLIGYGASPMPLEQLMEGIERIGPRFTQTYGQSEAPATITTLSQFDVAEAAAGYREALGSVGRPYTTNEVRVVTEDGQEAAPGEAGEITVRGPVVMMGYWRNEAATAERLVDGWVRTGDIGRIDDRGFVYLVDRKGDMIISGGYNVYPGEVEQALYKHPGVKEAAVIGFPDPEWGEVVTAVVSLRPGFATTGEEIKLFAAENLSSYKRPRRVEVWDSMPLSASGKIARREVKTRLTDSAGR